MALKIVKIGHPLLRKKLPNLSARTVQNPSFRKLAKSMVSTMRFARGVGLAANQIARNLRVMVMECQENRRYPKAPAFPLQVYLNPKIIRRSKKKEKGWEGCLSIPGFRGQVPRSRRITFTALTPEGKKVKRTVSGFEARVVQHEVDHLDGFFYVDRMEDFKSWTHLEEFNKRHGIKIRDRRS